MATALVAALGSNCAGDDEVRFTSDADARLMASLEGRWVAQSADGEVTLTLCEDVNATGEASEDVDCGDVRHVVRGGGRGVNEGVTVEGGRGGCEDVASAGLEGTLRLPDGHETPVRGAVSSVFGPGDDPYEPPFYLELQGSGSLPAVSRSVLVLGNYEPADVFDESTGRTEAANVFNVNRLFVYGGAAAGAGGSGGAAQTGAPPSSVEYNALRFVRVAPGECAGR